VFKPDFIGIGVARSGTTWLSRGLSAHPDVSLSVPKEVHFFCEKTLTSLSNWELGFGWYAHRFRGDPDTQKLGEMSTSYLSDPVAVERIHEHYPDTKLIAALRNPVDAIYSCYHHSETMYPMSDSFEAFIEDEPQFVDYYRYAPHIERLLKHFDRGQVHFILFEDIVSRPDKVLSDLYRFLDVDSDFRPPDVDQPVNQTVVPRIRWLRNTLGGTKRLLDKNPVVRRTYKRMRIEELGGWLVKRNSRRESVPQLDPATRAHLAEIFAESNQAVASLTGLDTSGWSETTSGEPTADALS